MLKAGSQDSYCTYRTSLPRVLLIGTYLRRDPYLELLGC